MGAVDRYFGVTAAGSTMRRELIGGVTTFATMSYIIFVQPAILSAAGMPFGSVLLATCLASAAACLMMGLIARYPFALAPGMGQNILFAFTVCGSMGFSWQAGLTIVLISGLLFLALSLFQFRERVLEVLPSTLKNAIGPAIGLFIAFVGLQWSGIIVPSGATMVTLGGFQPGPPLLVTGGVLLTAALMAWRVPGGILIGILATAGVGVLTGILPRIEEKFVWSFETFFSFGVAELVDRWDDALIAILLLFFLDLFDTVGTLIGVSRQAGFLTDTGQLPRASRAFFSDAAATCVGAAFGTSTVTSYIESATGVAAGARTGLAAVVTGVCFVAALLMAPIVHIAGTDVGPAFYGVAPTDLHVAMYPAVAPALIVVGFLMLGSLRRIEWDDVTESLPAFLTVVFMPFGFGITEGIAVGCISFTLIKVLAGRHREVHPAMYIIAAALIARYAFLM
jgi:adenine/guanine/hypoxanthine permease